MYGLGGGGFVRDRFYVKVIRWIWVWCRNDSSEMGIGVERGMGFKGKIEGIGVRRNRKSCLWKEFMWDKE